MNEALITGFPNCHLKRATFDFEDKDLKGRDRHWRWEAVPLMHEPATAVYELTFDENLNKSVPNGCLYEGRFLGYDSALAHIEYIQKRRTEARWIKP